jgi:hypothetical protein
VESYERSVPSPTRPVLEDLLLLSLISKFWSFWPTVARNLAQKERMSLDVLVDTKYEKMNSSLILAAILPGVLHFFAPPPLAVMWPRCGEARIRRFVNGTPHPAIGPLC